MVAGFAWITKRKKSKTHPKTNFLLIFNGWKKIRKKLTRNYKKNCLIWTHVTFNWIVRLFDWPKICLRRQIIPILRRERAPKKPRFFGQNFTPYFTSFFFKNLPAAQKILVKMGFLQWFGGSQKINILVPVDLKKVHKMFEFFFWKSPCPFLKKEARPK